MKNYLELEKIIQNSESVVFFGGAGVSTESNIPDFRSSDGLYKQKKYLYNAEVMLSHDFFVQNPKLFYEFYFNEMIYQNALPNKCHYALAELERLGKLKAVITQNIDGLHQMAGSKKVLELHGSVKRNYCMKCHHFMNEKEMIEANAVCSVCGGLMKPDVVLYQEGLDNQILTKAINAIANADVLIVGGTSLTVYPAAGLIQYFRGRHLILINRDITPYDNYAEIIIRDKIGDVMSQCIGE